jgi:hypothetical protein
MGPPAVNPRCPVKVLIDSHPFTKTSRCWGIENNKDGTSSQRVVIFRKS